MRKMSMVGLVILGFLGTAANVFGADVAIETVTNTGMDLKSLAAGFGLAIAVIAGATAQGRIGASFMEGASRNPGAVNVMKTQFLLSLIFVETLVLFTLVVALKLVGIF